MCIICNMPDFDKSGDEFLVAFDDARQRMREATEAMLRCSKVANTLEARERYDATHKRMKRLMADWNRLEQEREAGHVPVNRLAHD